MEFKIFRASGPRRAQSPAFRARRLLVCTPVERCAAGLRWRAVKMGKAGKGTGSFGERRA